MTITTQSFTLVNTGGSANDGTGDNIRDAFIAMNNNLNGFTTGISVGNLIASGSIVVPNSNAPSTVSDTGTPGQIAWDSGHIYVCIATNTWRRANLGTW